MSSSRTFPIYSILTTRKRTGQEVVRDICEAHGGKRPTDAAMRMWAYRYGRIPAQHVVALIYYCREKRVSFKDSDFDSIAVS